MIEGMNRQPSGPRRAGSFEAHLRRTRAMGVLALVAFAAGVVSDLGGGDFWTRHALLTGIASSVMVAAVTLAVVNEVLERRRRRRWSVLAQYVMLELVRNARMIWRGVLEVIGLLPAQANRPESIEQSASVVRDSAGFADAVRAAVHHDQARANLHREIAFLAAHSDQVLGRWAAVMLNAEVYAVVIDRHVELAGDLAWLSDLLDTAAPPDDLGRRRRAGSSPAVQIKSELSLDELADRIVVIARLAEALDRGTLEPALRIVPVQWWEARLAGNISTRPEAAVATDP
jgi:hypothetical protein